ncbi:hypothetical protein CBS101457_004003 [Exobasidium rhododendri]|nr:hypothetical protein CBS101457_004003 [Exobasidium rhododendri]
MSNRASLAPGSRRGPDVLSSSSQSKYLASSQTAGTSSPSTFSFRPHILLSQDGDKVGFGALLDYSDLNERIDMFREVFTASLEQSIAESERKAEEHAGRLREEDRKLESTRETIERQREELRKIDQTIAYERQADNSARAQLTKLQSSLASLEQRLMEADREKNRLERDFERKTQDRELRRARLIHEIKRNRPELLRFNEKLGCRISAGSEKPGGRGKSTIKFTFNLINPEDWSYEAKFVIDASTSHYKILSHSPAIPQEKLDRCLSDLNTSRALFTFIKRMRAAFKEEIERQRVAQRIARRDA